MKEEHGERQVPRTPESKGRPGSGVGAAGGAAAGAAVGAAAGPLGAAAGAVGGAVLGGMAGGVTGDSPADGGVANETTGATSSELHAKGKPEGASSRMPEEGKPDNN